MLIWMFGCPLVGRGTLPDTFLETRNCVNCTALNQSPGGSFKHAPASTSKLAAKEDISPILAVNGRTRIVRKN